MWNLLCHSPLLLRHSSLPLPGFKRFKLLQPSKSLALPAHSPVLLGHSSLPFASLQTLKTPKTPKTPKTLHRRCGTCFVIALCYWGIQACRYQASNVSNSYNPPNPSRHLPPPLHSSNCCMASSRQLPPSPLAVSLCCSRVAACPLPAPSAFQHCSLPLACT